MRAIHHPRSRARGEAAVGRRRRAASSARRVPSVAIAIATLLASLVASCAARPRFETGAPCERNGQCAAPLVCRLGRCREECRSPRDCALGLECLRDPSGLGACALPDEACERSTDCRPGLACVMGRCATDCAERPCAPGYACVLDEGTGARACVGTGQRPCIHHSECELDEICAPDRYCHEECHGDRDCRDGLLCDTAASICVLPGSDAGVADGGAPLDAPVSPLDAGVASDAPVSSDAGSVGATAPAPTFSAGDTHNCVVVDGRLACWGANGSGQIGSGVSGRSSGPTWVPVEGTTLFVSTGLAHTCALTTTGLFCWGDNTYHQLGSETTTASLVPIAVDFALPVTWLVSGDNHNCLIDDRGQVWCWGANARGQLGDGSTVARGTPRVVTGLPSPAVEVGARWDHTCARLEGGAVWCWGQNDLAQIGDGTPIGTDALTPVPVMVSGTLELAVGDLNGCARSAGRIQCWGENGSGQLGDGLDTARHDMSATPVDVVMTELPEILELSFGLRHACALGSDGTIWCWGDNFGAQLGFDSTVLSNRSTPIRVPSVSGAVRVIAGHYHTCAVLADGTIQCWGSHVDGALGDPTPPWRSTSSPVPIVLP
jgi:alpha-tubulin suppressor-like RCC1 family protein